MRTPPALIAILQYGRVLGDGEILDTDGQTQPIVYRIRASGHPSVPGRAPVPVPVPGRAPLPVPVPLRTPAPPVPQMIPVMPHALVAKIDNVGRIVEGQFDRAAIKAALLRNNWDEQRAIDSLYNESRPAAAPAARPYAGVSQGHLDRLMKCKPASMSIQQAIEIYRDICGSDISLAEDAVRQG
jgi:hypothetical protein